MRKKINIYLMVCLTLMMTCVFSAGAELVWSKRLPNLAIDIENKIVWQDSPLSKHSQVMTWSEAEDYCKNLSLDGFDKYRLPTVDELKTVNYKSKYFNYCNNYYNIYKHGFYWSSTPDTYADGYEKGYPTRASQATMTILPKCVCEDELFPKIYSIYKKELADDEKNAASRAAQEEKKIKKFRKSLKSGDSSSDGMILEVKGNLVKVQIRQCIETDYNGNCRNYGNAEKWFKRNELYPN